LAACNINSDANNEQVTLEYNKQQIRDTAIKARDTAKNLAVRRRQRRRARPAERSRTKSATWTST
jgi:hypothetical protein